MNNIVKIIIGTAIGASIMKIFGNTGILITLGLLVGVLALIYKFQNKMLYMPQIPNASLSPKDNPRGYRHPSEQGMSAENVVITTSDNIKLQGWLISNPNYKRLVVYFHQNAGNIGFRIPFIKNIHEQTNSNVLIVAYRGYSDSQGEPTEEGLQLDAFAIMDYAIKLKSNALAHGESLEHIYVLGRSLGGAVSIYVAGLSVFKKAIKGYILQNTFTSIQDMVKVLFPPLAYLQFLHRNFWPSEKRIGEIETPILFVRCLRDQIVPTQQMQKLIKLATSCQKKYVHQIPYGTHNYAWEVDVDSYFGKLNQYFQSLE